MLLRATAGCRDGIRRTIMLTNKEELISAHCLPSYHEQHLSAYALWGLLLAVSWTTSDNIYGEKDYSYIVYGANSSRANEAPILA